MKHYLILAGVLLVSGLFGGIVNFYMNYSAGEKRLFPKAILTGIAASIMVPLFLRMISSDLIVLSETNPMGYFYIAGFCLVASIFSKSFMQTVSDKVLNKLKETEDKVNKAEDELRRTAETVTEEKEKVSLLIGQQEEPDDSDSDEKIVPTIRDYMNLGLTDAKPFLTEDIKRTLGAMQNPRFRFRTTKGISKDTGIKEDVVIFILEAGEEGGYVRKIMKDEKELWALTEKGRSKEFYVQDDQPNVAE